MRFAWAILVGACLWGGQATAAEQRFEQTHVSMGTQFRIVLYATDEPAAKEALAAANKRIDKLHAILSDYDEQSELSRLSAQAPTALPVVVSDDLFGVLVASQRVAEASSGAFDVTAGPLTKLWRRARRQRELPNAERLAEAQLAVGYKHLVLKPNPTESNGSVSLLAPNMRLDLGGIAKGYAADEALALLKSLGFPRAMVAASGDLALGDPPPGETGWKIGLAPISPDAPPSRIMRLANCGVSTSGDTFQFVEINGTRHSHIIDPRTGLAISERWLVSVIAPTCMESDAFATALCVVGPQAGLKLAEVEKLAVLYVNPVTKAEETSKNFDELASKAVP